MVKIRGHVKFLVFSNIFMYVWVRKHREIKCLCSTFTTIAVVTCIQNLYYRAEIRKIMNSLEIAHFPIKCGIYGGIHCLGTNRTYIDPLNKF